MNNECLNIMTFADRNVFSDLSYPIFAYIKKLRFTIEFLCPALRGPCLGFSFYVCSKVI